MDALAQVALLTKAKIVFETSETFLSFPALSPLSYAAENLSFAGAATMSTQGMEVFSEFCRLTNMLPNGILFQPSADRFLWDVFYDVLQNKDLAQGQLTAKQNSDLENAIAFLSAKGPDGAPTDSDAVVAYKQYRDAWITATQNYKAQQLSATCSSDPAVLALWKNTTEPQLREELQSAESAWEKLGFKAQVEEAQEVKQSLAGQSPGLTWQSWSSLYDPDIDLQTDPQGQPFALTAFSPADVVVQSKWPSFNISSGEIPKLVSQASKELTDVFGTVAGNSTIDSLSFEFCSVGLNRPWFKPDVFSARFWRFSDPAKELSDGGNPPKGIWPAYIVGIVFGRNIAVASHSTASALQREPIRVFPPLLLCPDIRLATPIMARPTASVQRAAPMELRSIVLPRLNNVTFKALPLATRLQSPAPVRPIAVPQPSSSQQAPEPAHPSPPIGAQPTASSNQISILAFICKHLPKCPNPDPAFSWGS